MVGVVVLVVTSACGSAGNESLRPPRDTTGPAAPAVSRVLVGTTWFLSDFGGDRDRSGASFSLFPDGRYTLDDGGAVFTGTYTLHPNGIAFSPETGSGAAMTDTAGPSTAEPTGGTNDGTVPDARTVMRGLQQPLTGDVFLGLSQDGLTLSISTGRTSARFRYGGPA